MKTLESAPPEAPPNRAAAAGGKSRGGPGSARRQRARTGWAYTGPTLFVVGAVTIFPILFSVVLSFTSVRMTYDGFRIESFTTGNYAALLQSAEWREALLFTVFYTVVTVFAELVLGTLAALILERLGAGRGWIMALLLVPWSLITVVSAQLWGYIYDASYGLATWFFDAVLGHAPVILGTPSSAVGGMMIADIWKTTPFVAIIVLSGLVMLDRDVFEAAEIDGLGAWSTFWRVTLPQLRPVIGIAVLFRILQAFGIFDLPFVLTQGGPGTATQSLAILGYKTLFQNLNMGPGAAIATSTALLVLVCCLLFLRAFRSQVSEGELR
ncbi:MULTISPECIES: carbohydrate ABC transporter permease [Streptomyces]|uniref:Sugar ABC transporter permease n=1 Tax=Streptomyces lycii TaxID=2654337 RepID=A0ABQ7FJB1_9ACTN|nr:MULTISPECIES: sugar ABC transporter permease [Streptomyces]KAF4407704.1 sugar ABC transporter permease [Streptomyces lycii]PGH47522.1 sugar ABC transporter permease [Streptomyces sp. Ru87]